MKKYLFTLYIVASYTLVNHHLYGQNGNWTIKGPIDFPLDISGQIHGIGRVSQLKFHPTNSQKMYAVSASGGLWISTNAGANWNKTSTDNEIPQGSCASICIDYTNDNILYLSTGDANYNSNGYGIYKSIDGGITWNPATTGIGNRMASEMIMSPTDHNTILAATKQGIWKTTDAGATWVVKKSVGNFWDIEYKPGSANIVYATTDKECWKSTDNGETWNKIPSINPTIGTNGRITTSEANPALVYVAFVGSNNNNGGGIIYQSLDEGNTFTLKKGDVNPNLNGYEAVADPGQGEYNWDVFADRDNPNILYVVAHVVWKSTDGGVNWTQLTNWWEKCHTDMHHIVSSPYDHNKLFNANDGGVFLSTDGGITWAPSSNGLSATEIYSMGQSKLVKNIISIGTQDNGELFLNNNAWTCNRGGDWTSKMTYSYADATTVYYHAPPSKKDVIANSPESPIDLSQASNVENYIFSETNTSFALASQGQKLNKTTNLLSPTPTWTVLNTFNTTIKNVTISPTNNNEIYVVLSNRAIYYSANGNSFTNISTAPNPTNIYSKIVVTKNNTNIVYLTCNNKVYQSSDKGVSWTNISGTLPTLNIISLIHDPYSTNESFYLATPLGVYYKNNSMTDWIRYSTGLPLIAQITGLEAYFDGTTNSTLSLSFYGRGVWRSGTVNQNGLSTDELINNAGAIRVYPNPSSSIITIDVTKPALMETKAILLDINGKKLTEIDISNPITLLDFSTYIKGLYYLKFSDNTIEKVVIE